MTYLEVPSAAPSITEDDVARVIETLHSGVLANGPQARLLEEEFAALCQAPHCAAVSSGTDALLLSGLALGLGAGDTVLVPAFTFAATANAFLAIGCRVVVVDIDPLTFNMDPADLERALAEYPEVAAVCVVDLYGSTDGTDAAIEMARNHQVRVIEDACQAHGALTPDGSGIGSRADATAFSLYATKNVSGGEGGLIVSPSEEVDKAIRLLRNHGAIQTYRHSAFGLNRRLPEVSAALARGPLSRLDQTNESRWRHASLLAGWLTGAFKDRVVPPKEASSPQPASTHVFHQFTALCADSKLRDRLLDGLQSRGIDARVFYPYVLSELPGVVERPVPQATRCREATISLPVHPALSETQLDHLRAVIVDLGTSS